MPSVEQVYQSYGVVHSDNCNICDFVTVKKEGSMAYHFTAIYVGDNNNFFDLKKGQRYPLTVRKHWWSKRLAVYVRQGYFDDMVPGTLHHFRNWSMFNNFWRIKEVE